jgi:hypothetical protein
LVVCFVVFGFYYYYFLMKKNNKGIEERKRGVEKLVKINGV